MSTGILLHSGRFYNYIDPELNDYTIEDIALGLSNICRFGGQVGRHYSVAQHCYLASIWVETGYELDALLHDATEAFLCDVPTPLKNLLPEYREIEKKHEADMARRFGIQYPFVPAVKVIDQRMLAAEVRDLKVSSDHWDFLKDVVPVHTQIDPWPQDLACAMFLKRYYTLKTTTKEFCGNFAGKM